MIHPHAVVSPDAEIGERTRVWQFASIIRGARIGADGNIGSCAIVDGAVIGDRCLVGHGAAVNPGVLIGDDVFVGPNVTFCNDAWPRTHKDGFALHSFNGKQWAVIVENGAAIGAGAILLPGVRIGAGATIAAGATVARDVPVDYLLLRNGSVQPIGSERTRMRFADATGRVL